MPLTKKTPDPL